MPNNGEPCKVCGANAPVEVAVKTPNKTGKKDTVEVRSEFYCIEHTPDGILSADGPAIHQSVV
jgi:hypothetical protein